MGPDHPPVVEGAVSVEITYVSLEIERREKVGSGVIPLLATGRWSILSLRD